MERKVLTTEIDLLLAEELTDDEYQLYVAAREATKTSHSPYSHFRVGAAVLLSNGDIVTGSNQENASFGLTVCAERSALFRLAAMGRKRDVRKLFVTGRRDIPEEQITEADPLPPCGACRQVIKEYQDLAGEPLTILFTAWKGRIGRVRGIEALLPLAFGPGDFGVDVD